MPIYEYYCKVCGKKYSLFISSQSKQEVKCDFCGSSDAERLISRVSVLKSEESRFEKLAKSAMLHDVDENDPKSIARWMKKFGGEFRDELGGDFQQEIEKAMEETEKKNNEENDS